MKFYSLFVIITLCMIATVSYSQNVGIGTASPQAQLHIDAGASTTNGFIGNRYFFFRHSA